MFELQNVGQPIRTSVLTPGGVYSRVVSVNPVDCTSTRPQWAFTPPLGQRLWLMNVQVWSEYYSPAAYACAFYVKVLSGQVPVTQVQCESAEDVLPMFIDGRRGSWYYYQRTGYFSWDMAKLYTGEPVRLGIIVYNNVLESLRVFGSFEISEG